MSHLLEMSQPSPIMASASQRGPCDPSGSTWASFLLLVQASPNLNELQQLRRQPEVLLGCSVTHHSSREARQNVSHLNRICVKGVHHREVGDLRPQRLVPAQIPEKIRLLFVCRLPAV